MPKRLVDIVVHIPLEAEYNEFVAVFPVIEEFPSELNLLACVEAPNGFKIGVVLQEKMGRSAAQAACEVAFEAFEFKAYVCLGIAGGLSKDLDLGDVCYTGTLIDIYDNAKVTDAASGGLDIQFAPEFYSTLDKITAALGFVRTLSQLRDCHKDWQETQCRFAENLLPDPVPGRGDALELVRAPKCLNGDIVCGQVAESDIYRTRLKGITRKILAIETESGPIFDMCREARIPVLTIRGISDYANASKGELEAKSQNAVRSVAARNAATFFHLQLNNPLFAALIRGEAGAVEEQLPLGDITANPLPRVTDQLTKEFDKTLRELSPAYRSKPLGYRLPSPRVRREAATSATDQDRKSRLTELIDAIPRYRRMLVYVPRTYPDQALPWVFAQSLLQSDINGKKIIPIVIDGRRVGPPRDTFAHLSQIDLDPDIAVHGGEYVFIVNEPSLTSKTRLAFLAAEANKYEGSHIVFVTRSERAIVEAMEGYRLLKTEPFSLADISFMEMAVFLERAYDLPSKEADVTALKLRDTFSRFSLPAHPSFFAGIPSETLSSLISANRRSELIQLAVDGILTFLVAADKDPVRMSRSNRSKFLRQLIVEIAYNKRTFTESELVAFAQKISDEYDYGFNALSFINSFVESGIINFLDGRAEVTLPFIQSYLLADEISKDSEKAAAYFVAEDDNFDLLTFDLYAEIGASPSFIAGVMEDFKKTIGEMEVGPDNQLLLTGEINPALFKNPDRIRGLTRRVTQARTAIANGECDRSEKASILDIADRVNEDIAHRAESDDRDDTRTNELQLLTMLLRRWLLASILLGAGAEGLNGSDRQSLAELVLIGSEALLDGMTRHLQKIDFSEIKSQIADDTEFKQALGVTDEAEFKGLTSALVDFLEYVALSEPLDHVFDALPDRASHKIVGNSLMKVEAKTKMQQLIKGVWLTSIDHLAGKKDLQKSVADLPEVQFLRAALTSILINRVKWKIADERTQLAFLDAAEQLVKPYNPHMNKGEIIRFVEKQVAQAISDGVDGEEEED